MLALFLFFACGEEKTLGCDGDVLGGDYRVSFAPFRIFYPCDCVGLDPWQNWRTKFRPRNADGAL